MANLSSDPAALAATESKTDTETKHSSKSIVEAGYDLIAPRYLEWTTSSSSPRLRYLHRLLDLLPGKSRVLELGCGAGVPGTQLLSEKHEVTGNDISGAQIELAKKHVPNAKFVKGDMMNLEFEERSFGAVVAFYSLIHLPRSEQGVMLKKIGEWLGDEGLLLLNLGSKDNPGSINEDWLGGKMYWSSFDAATNVEMVRLAGFEIVEEEHTHEEEDGKVVPFLWILAKKRKTEYVEGL